ncbi:MAG TPA: alpha-D-glucose phosphate-specific phosphoglucomutase, partial [Gammaproteobacteria bacterium]|nr:alpha-D-glucose phosphate-specific phosphoglucomutase [Gammaproteobacteria bacterium]
LHQHWAEYGRDFFLREDYDIPDTAKAARVMRELEAALPTLAGKDAAGTRIASADSFTYADPVDGGVSRNQGLRIFTADGGRMVFRLSGTGTRGATLRIYLERYEADVPKQQLSAVTALASLSAAARAIARLEELTGIGRPTAVT